MKMTLNDFLDFLDEGLQMNIRILDDEKDNDCAWTDFSLWLKTNYASGYYPFVPEKFAKKYGNYLIAKNSITAEDNRIWFSIYKEVKEKK